jgi:four helix bundle protein
MSIPCNARPLRPTGLVVQFDHDRLEAYMAAVDMVALTQAIVGAFPPGHADLADQLKRASTSIALNIAEGAGEYSRADKARFFAWPSGRRPSARPFSMSRRTLAIISRERFETGRALLLRVVSMLIKMVQKLAS